MMKCVYFLTVGALALLCGCGHQNLPEGYFYNENGTELIENKEAQTAFFRLQPGSMRPPVFECIERGWFVETELPTTLSANHKVVRYYRIAIGVNDSTTINGDLWERFWYTDGTNEILALKLDGTILRFHRGAQPANLPEDPQDEPPAGQTAKK